MENDYMYRAAKILCVCVHTHALVCGTTAVYAVHDI
eukprot:SAG31_NODE_11437_length_1030_cov_1.651987_2_plen_35_part_01